MSGEPPAGSGPLILTFARRFARSRRLRVSVVPVFVATVLVTGLYVALVGQSLTPEQIAQRDMGRYGAFAGFGAGDVAPGSTIRESLATALPSTSDRQSNVAVISTDLAVPAVAHSSVRLIEMDWAQDPFPGNYRMLSGRWPERPGEAIIVNPDAATGSIPDHLSLYGGRVKLTVVGTVDDLFTGNVEVFAGPGTWAGMDPDLASLNTRLRAQPVVYWDGTDVAGTIAAIAEALRAASDDPAAGDLVDRVQQTYTSRQSVLSQTRPSWIDRSPAGYTIPSLALPLLSTLAAFALTRRHVARSVRRMISVGVPRRIAVGGVGLAQGAWCLVATVAGHIVGLALGVVAARITAEVLAQPTGPIPTAVGPLARTIAMVVAGCAFGTLLIARARAARTDPARGSGPTTAQASPTRRDGLVRNARHLLATLAVGVALTRLPGLDSPAKAMQTAGILAAAVLLMLPDLIPALLRRLPEANLRARLSKRQLLADTSRVTMLIAAIAMLLGLSTGFVSLLDTMMRTAGAEVYPDVLPGQVQIADNNTDVQPAPPTAVKAAQTVPALRDQTPVTIHFLATTDGTTVTHIIAGQAFGLVLAVDSAADADRLLRTKLNERQRALLARGGILFWDHHTPIGATVDLRHQQTDTVSGVLATIPAEAFHVNEAAWNVGTTGLVLTATAGRHHLPITAGTVIFTDISSADAEAAQTAVTAAGMDPRNARIHRTPPRPIPPMALNLTAVGVVILALAVTLTLTQTQTRILREHLGHLIALGLSTRWARTIVIRQHLVLTVLATAIGLLIGLPAALLAAWRLPGFVLSIPWEQLAILTAAVYSSIAVATALATRRLTAKDRLTA
ncbi:FtsX-like permease family protein [Plantactinospora sp. CA-290183]|uniref:FtsX-like permease family protein n=1 Tax=Plantactinospora sp. CA-290183 TaxID=3240006 RepID=UPI003D8EA022